MTRCPTLDNQSTTLFAHQPGNLKASISFRTHAIKRKSGTRRLRQWVAMRGFEVLTGFLGSMASSGNDKKLAGVGKKAEARKGDPDWASGLKRLYNSVVEEPLPDSFKDLLSKLDDEGRK